MLGSSLQGLRDLLDLLLVNLLLRVLLLGHARAPLIVSDQCSDTPTLCLNQPLVNMFLL